MAGLLLTQQAETDRIGIWAYIAADSETAATRFLQAMDARCQLLAENPMAGRSRNELAQRLRSIPFGNYVIFYRPMSDGIQVIRILHGARDVDLLFWIDPTDTAA
jgi:toxin ParE1/3/4